MREQRRALSNHCCHALNKRRCDEIALAGDPTRIANHIKGVVFVRVENSSHCVAHTTQPAAMRVHNAFWLTRRARGVDDEKREVGVDAFYRQHCIELGPDIGCTFRRQIIERCES